MEARISLLLLFFLINNAGLESNLYIVERRYKVSV
jgi:hypothetical protein